VDGVNAPLRGIADNEYGTQQYLRWGRNLQPGNPYTDMLWLLAKGFIICEPSKSLSLPYLD
jgi:hypothetical protein